MGRKRTDPKQQGLPTRWKLQHGAYYYQVPKQHRHLWDGKALFRLGKTLPEAYRVWANRLEEVSNVRTFGDLLERYALEVVPTKAPKSQRADFSAIERIRPVFGSAPLSSIKPSHVYKYRDKIGKISHAYANRDIAVISHAYTKAVEWGLIDKNPIKGQVVKYGQKARDRYVQDWELEEFLSVAPDLIRAYLPVKMATGLRKGDLLGLKLADLRDDGIHVKTSKTGKRLVIEWSDELREAVSQAKALHGKLSSVWLFCTRRGQPYRKDDGSTSGFDSIWQRAMKKAITETKLTERFTEHDLRAKVASDTDLDHASKLLGHSKSEITEKVYRRKGEVVKPAHWKG